MRDYNINFSRQYGLGKGTKTDIKNSVRPLHSRNET